MTTAEVKKKGIDEELIRRQKAIYACLVCNEMFKDPGLCPNCSVVLKKKAG